MNKLALAAKFSVATGWWTGRCFIWGFVWFVRGEGGRSSCGDRTCNVIWSAVRHLGCREQFGWEGASYCYCSIIFPCGIGEHQAAFLNNLPLCCKDQCCWRLISMWFSFRFVSFERRGGGRVCGLGACDVLFVASNLGRERGRNLEGRESITIGLSVVHRHHLSIAALPYPAALVSMRRLSSAI